MNPIKYPIRTFQTNSGVQKLGLFEPFIVSSHYDSKVRIWVINESDGNLNLLTTWSGHPIPPTKMLVDTQKRLYTYSPSMRSMVRTWDLGCLDRDLVFKHDNMTDFGVMQKNNETLLFCTLMNGMVNVHNVKNEEVIQSFDTKDQNLSSIVPVSDDYFYTAADNKIKFWDNRNLSNYVYCFNGHQDSVFGLELINNSHILSYSLDGCILCWEVNTGNVKLKIDVDYFISRVAVSHKIWVQSTDFIDVYNFDGTLNGQIDASENGKVKSMITQNQHLVTGSSDRVSKVWDENGDLVCSLSGHQDEVTQLASNKNWIYSGSIDCTIKQWTYE
jgi:WD40 repeat protein